MDFVSFALHPVFILNQFSQLKACLIAVVGVLLQLQVSPLNAAFSAFHSGDENYLSLQQFYWTSPLIFNEILFLSALTLFLYQFKVGVIRFFGGAFGVLSYSLFFAHLSILDWAASLPETQYFQNTLLLNELNKMHPPLFLLILPGLIVFTSLNCSHYPPQLLVLTFIFLGLGSWWAYQEGNWGGFWSWDPSEVLGWSFFLIILNTIHVQGSRPVTNNSKSWNSNQLFTVSMCLILYLVLQLNYTLFSHSFGMKVSSKLALEYTEPVIIFFLWVNALHKVINLTRVEKLNMCSVNAKKMLPLIPKATVILYLLMLVFTFQPVVVLSPSLISFIMFWLILLPYPYHLTLSYLGTFIVLILAGGSPSPMPLLFMSWSRCSTSIIHKIITASLLLAITPLAVQSGGLLLEQWVVESTEMPPLAFLPTTILAMTSNSNTPMSLGLLDLSIDALFLPLLLVCGWLCFLYERSLRQ